MKDHLTFAILYLEISYCHGLFYKQYAMPSQVKWKKKKVLQKCNFSNAQCNEDKLFSLGRRRKQNRLLVPKAVQIESQ